MSQASANAVNELDEVILRAKFQEFLANEYFEFGPKATESEKRDILSKALLFHTHKKDADGIRPRYLNAQIQYLWRAFKSGYRYCEARKS